MNTVKEIINIIKPYQKERIIMNVNQFDQLLKRVNLEEDTTVKTHILNVIEKYLDVISADVAPTSVEEVKGIEASIEEAQVVKEDIVPTEAVEEVKAAEKVEETVVVDVVAPAPTILPIEEDPTPEGNLSEKEQMEYDAAVMNAEEVQTMEDIEEEAALRDEVSVAEAVTQEATPPEVLTETPVVTSEYVEEFGLISTTNEEAHLKEITERGGVLFRDKRSFMLMLCLDDELVAIAKTAKLEQFPKEVQEHMKSGGFVSCDIISFGEITKRSRARYTDVTYRNLQLLDKEHWIVQNVTNLLEKGEVPEHAKKEKEVIEEVPATETVSEVTVDEKPYLISTFMINPGFVEIFKNQKDDIISQSYGISSEEGTAKFFTKNTDGSTVLIGVDQKSPLKPNLYSAKIIDYTMKEINGKTHVQFKLDADIVETEQPAPVSTPVESTEVKEQVEVEQAPPIEQPKRANVGLKAIGEIPADFPATNSLSIELFPVAEAMFNIEQTQGMIGHALSLGMITRPEDNIARISLMQDVFEMGTTVNTLTSQPMRNSKWVVRISEVDLVVNEETKCKSLVVKFDSILEIETFPHEKEEVLDVLDYTPITEESYGARQRDIAVKREAANAATKQPIKAPTTPEEMGQEKVSAESMLHKDVTPQAAQQLLNPNPAANYTNGYNELVTSQSKDMGGAVQELRDKTALNQQNRAQLMDQAQGVITGVISQTLKETNILTKTEEKQTTTVVGNLQDGAGNLSQTETVINFATGFSPQAWAQSIGKQIQLRSELQFGNGPATMKTVSMVGKGGAIVGQGQVPITEALLLDGNQHTATLLSIEHATQENQGFIVSLRIGNFKVA